MTFPTLHDVLGLAHGIYALCVVLSFGLVWQWVGKTKGTTLGDMHRQAWRHEHRVAS